MCITSCLCVWRVLIEFGWKYYQSSIFYPQYPILFFLRTSFINFGRRKISLLELEAALVKARRTYIITLFWLSVVQNNFLCILFLAVWGWSSVWHCYNLWHLCCSWQDSVSRQRSLVSALIFTLTLVLNFLLSKCRLTDLQKIDNFKNGGTFQIFSFWILDIHKK